MKQHTKIDPITIQFKTDEELMKISRKEGLTAREHFIIAKEIGDRVLQKDTKGE